MLDYNRKMFQDSINNHNNLGIITTQTLDDSSAFNFTVWLVCTIGFNSSYLLVPYYIEWYKSIGIHPKHMLFNINIQPNDDMEKFDILKRHLSHNGIINYREWREIYSDDGRKQIEQELIDDKPSDSDYVMINDIDEFQNWKGKGVDNIYQFINAEMIPNGFEYAHGFNIDMFANNATRTEPIDKYDGNTSISMIEQYPWKCDFTTSIVNAWNGKICFHKNVYKLEKNGHHLIGSRKNSESINVNKLEYSKFDLEIFHFKWQGNVIKYLSERIKRELQQNFHFVYETQSGFNWLLKNSGKVNLAQIEEFHCTLHSM